MQTARSVAAAIALPALATLAITVSLVPAAAAYITNCDPVTRYSKVYRINQFDQRLRHNPGNTTNVTFGPGDTHAMTNAAYDPVAPVHVLTNGNRYVILNGQIGQGNGCLVTPPNPGPGPIDGGGTWRPGCLIVGKVQVCLTQ